MKVFDDEAEENKKKGWLLISKIKEAIKRNGNKIDFFQIRKELLNDSQLDDELKEQLSEEEIERLVSKYSSILGDAYKKYLDHQNLENIILNYIEQENLGVNISELDKVSIKESVRQYITELVVIYKDQRISQENLAQILNNYDEEFEELYKRYIYIQKNVLTVLNLIDLDKSRQIIDRETLKQKIKGSIQSKCKFYQDNLSKDLKDLLKEYDLLFDWAYKRLSMEEQENTFNREQEAGKMSKIEKGLQFIPVNRKKADIIDFVKAKKIIREEKEEENLWEK